MAKARSSVTRTSRDRELTRLLENRRRDLVRDVLDTLRSSRDATPANRGVLDLGESSEVEMQEALAFTLAQMKSETLQAVDEALRRLRNGTYGDCRQCGRMIAASRLRALPFAVRCKPCEEAREAATERPNPVSVPRIGDFGP